MTKKITLQVTEDDFEFAKRLSKIEGYFGAEDCINGILNSAITDLRERVEDHNAERRELRRLHEVIDRQSVKISVLKELLMEAMEDRVHRQLQHETELNQAESMREEIPF